MTNHFKNLSLILILLFLNFPVGAKENLRELFKNNEAIIYTINIRNFGAQDLNNDGIIEVDKGDIEGNFLNAKDKLKELKDEGINTIYVLPITKTGKIKALGTAGSLYAMDSFNEINEQLKNLNSNLTINEEAKKFINEAHRLDFNVIVDLPACGSYDLSLKKPDYFIQKENSKNVIPADWTDVRLFKMYNNDKTLNKENLKNFKSFVDLTVSLGFDGIRADVAAIKPKEFWKQIIEYARSKNKDFLFLAEASPNWDNPANDAIDYYTTIDELLEAGFDSYYGSWSNFSNITSKKDFDKNLLQNIKILKKHKNSSIISALATHDQKAPVLKGLNYWDMVLWLSVALPQNTYFLDGFKQGDDFTYTYENKVAKNTLTDDNYYFVHSGLFDIFNLTGPVRIKHPNLKNKYLKAIDFKKRHNDLISNGKLTLLNTNNDKIFAYSIINQDRELIVIGSLDEKNSIKTSVKSKYLKKDYLFSIINSKYHPIYKDNTISTELEPFEIQVFMISLSKYRAM